MEFREEEEEVPLLLETQQEHPLRAVAVMNFMSCEFFEGLAVKGLVTVMAIFFLEYLHYNENTATELVHLFLVCPLLVTPSALQLARPFWEITKLHYSFSMCNWAGLFFDHNKQTHPGGILKHLWLYSF